MTSRGRLVLCRLFVSALLFWRPEGQNRLKGVAKNVSDTGSRWLRRRDLRYSEGTPPAHVSGLRARSGIRCGTLVAGISRAASSGFCRRRALKLCCKRRIFLQGRSAASTLWPRPPVADDARDGASRAPERMALCCVRYDEQSLFCKQLHPSGISPLPAGTALGMVQYALLAKAHQVSGFWAPN